MTKTAEQERAAVVAWLLGTAAQFRREADRQGKRVGPRAAGFEDAANCIKALLHHQGEQ
jgi:hypothetical protein